MIIEFSVVPHAYNTSLAAAVLLRLDEKARDARTRGGVTCLIDKEKFALPAMLLELGNNSGRAQLP